MTCPPCHGAVIVRMFEEGSITNLIPRAFYNYDSSNSL